MYAATDVVINAESSTGALISSEVGLVSMVANAVRAQFVGRSRDALLLTGVEGAPIDIYANGDIDVSMTGGNKGMVVQLGTLLYILYSTVPRR